MIQPRKLKAIDLFCGCGGISVALQKAGFDIIAGIDIEKKYLASFKHNFKSAKALNADITSITPNDFMSLVGIVPEELDILVGGPPCQGFSKNTPRKNRYLEDSKNLLVKSFLDYCEVIRPKNILMENVAEMKNGFDEAYSLEVVNRLQNAGYNVTSVVLNSADFGVPQKRRRAFFMANRHGVKFLPPTPTHTTSKKNIASQLSFVEGASYVTVWEAIGDLPSLKHGAGSDLTSYISEPQTSYQRLMRGSLTVVKNHIARKLADKQYERLNSLEPGQGLKDLPLHLQTKGGYSGAYGRLTKDSICPTITRWVFHPGSGRWGHPVDIRTLTIREVARIQSFPDEFEFIGSYTDQAGQLGNAVPPLLAQSIIESMLYQVMLFKNDVRASHDNFSVGNLKAIA